jgi:hypothetical protein
MIRRWRAEAIQQMLLDLVRFKFGEGPLPLVRRIEQEQDEERLIRWAVLLLTASLEQFSRGVMAPPSGEFC